MFSLWDKYPFTIKTKTVTFQAQTLVCELVKDSREVDGALLWPQDLYTPRVDSWFVLGSATTTALPLSRLVK